MDKQQEMTTELRRARTWILVVGILMFLFDMVVVYVQYGDQLPSEIKTKYAIYASLILAYFVGMWWLARYKPVLACVLALVGFWGVHLYVGINDPSQLYKGLLMKILFTLALIRGIKSANRAEELRKELGRVFD